MTTLPSKVPTSVILLFCLLLSQLSWAQQAPAPLPPQEPPQAPSTDKPDNTPPIHLSNLPKRFATDQLRFWSSPFRHNPHRGRIWAKYVLPLGIISAVTIATDQSTSNALPNSFDQTKWSGRASQFGAWYSLAGISGGSYILGKITKNDRFRESGLLGLEALGHAQVIVFVAKQATNRQRPVDGDGKGRFWSGGTSFPSGHAMSSFAVATVFAHEFSDHPMVGIAAYGLAGTVAASRMSARRHWLSDIIVGGSAGWVIGHFTYRRNHKLKFPGGGTGSSSSTPSKAQRFIPQVGIGGTTFRLSWQL